MGFGEFLIICIIVVALAALAVWILGQMGAPPLIVKIVWFVAALIIIVTLARAVGLLGHDVMIPRIG
jgi:hypothetical protein